jgi:hypothetical protein
LAQSPETTQRIEPVSGRPEQAWPGCRHRANLADFIVR